MTTLALLSRRRGPGRRHDQTYRLRNATALIFLSFGLLTVITHAESSWVIPGFDATAVARFTGFNAPPINVDWKDASIDSWRPSEPLGRWSVVQVSPQRDVPANRISALLGLSSPFGETPDRIPTNAIVDRAHLWLPITAIRGHFQIQIRAIPVADSDWQPLDASPLFKSPGQSWSGGSILDPSLPLLGTCDTPPQTGWFEVPIDLAPSLDALRLGLFGGWLLTSETEHAPDVRTLQWTSSQSASTRDYPALFVEWHRPKVGPDVSKLPDILSSYSDTFTFLWSTNACQSLTVDGQPLTPSASGVWVVSVTAGPHELLAINNQGTSTRRFTVAKRSLAIETILRDLNQRVYLTWNGLPDWDYAIEEGGDGIEGWTRVMTVEGRAGPMAQSVLNSGIYHHYRLNAVPNPRLYSAP